MTSTVGPNAVAAAGEVDCAELEEFAELVPPEAEFEVRYTEKAGRFMTSKAAMSADYDFLIESPLAVWPLSVELETNVSSEHSETPLDWIREPSWCERCMRRLQPDADSVTKKTRCRPQASGRVGRVERRRLRRRVLKSQQADDSVEYQTQDAKSHEEEEGREEEGEVAERGDEVNDDDSLGTSHKTVDDAPEGVAETDCPVMGHRDNVGAGHDAVGRRDDSENGADIARMYCVDCAARAGTRPVFFTRGLLQRWRTWQVTKSTSSRVGLEAFGRCFAQVAETAAVLREAHQLDPDEALRNALRPFDRLAAPPLGSSVTLHGTSAAEVSLELLTSEPFVTAVNAAIGCPREAAKLLSDSSVDALAGRLVMNTAAIEVPGAGPGGETLLGAAVFVLLSTMNHSCDASAAAKFESGSCEVTLRTNRSVAHGEPLTLAYVPGDWPLAARQERLRHWFFECDCIRCESETRVFSALGSDGRDDCRDST